MSIITLQGDKERAKGIYYEIDTAISPIGIGGMGRVYRGLCINRITRESKPVAVKFIFEDSPITSIERARREASIQLRNDNLIEMLGFIETQNKESDGMVISHYHVVSELLHGVTLMDVLDGKDVDFEGKKVPFAAEMYQMYNSQRERFALIIVKSVLSGLMALHDNGYIHRDIDPSNIMLTADEHVKLIDFGIAKRLDMLTSEVDVQFDPCQKERLVGKMSYAAPELVKSDVAHQDKTTDIYAVGILLYQLLCGHLPFEGTMQEIMEMQLNADIPLGDISNPILRNIIKKATEKQQGNRFQSTSEFRVALDKCPIGQRGSSKKKHFSIPFPYVMVGITFIGLTIGIVLALIL